VTPPHATPRQEGEALERDAPCLDASSPRGCKDGHGRRRTGARGWSASFDGARWLRVVARAHWFGTSIAQHARGVAPVASLGSMTVGLCVHCCVLDVSSPPRSLRTRVPRLVQLPGRRWDRPLRAEPEELGVDDPCAKFSPKCASRPGTSGPRTRRPRATGSPSTWASPGKRPKATKTRPHFIWRIERRNARERNGLSARVYHAVGL
jgi:hypothetical protein